MSRLPAGERFLLDQIRRGDADGWSRLVSRYQGRLLAYARPRFVNVADSEDVVQETFLSFLRGLEGFREQSSLETYLFSILRRRIVDRIRVGGRNHDIPFCAMDRADDRGEQERFEPVAADPSASWCAVNEEQNDEQRRAVEHALVAVVYKLRETQNFRDLMICEMVFYGQVRNKQIANVLSMEQKQVALIKHRFIKRLQEQVKASHRSSTEPLGDNLLSVAWESARPSCPKRSTVGKFVLETLDGEWRDYVAFHLDKLGCQFCRANRDDLVAEQDSDDDRAFRHRVFQSTVGFLK